MPLKSLVKVSHLSNLSDARYCAGMGVEMLGFCAVPTTRHYLTPQVYQDIRGWVAGPRIVAELYGVESAATIESVLREYAPDYLELSYAEYERFEDFLTLPCIVHVDDLSEIKQGDKKPGIAYVVVNDDESCAAVSLSLYPVLVKVASLEKLNALSAAGCFDGFVLSGPEDNRPGYTNYDELGEILEALEEDT